LRGVIPQHRERLLYCDHVEAAGQELFDLVCKRDLEGIVAKRKYDPYLLDGSAAWLKIRNTDYSQWTGREELFERERSGEPGCECTKSSKAGRLH
jgi:ATP-dependent DNA ligase